jgi:hypothetical protein
MSCKLASKFNFPNPGLHIKNPDMKLFLLLLVPFLAAVTAVFFCAPLADAASARGATAFQGQLGLQLYSLRSQFAKDVPGTLAEVRSFGIRNVELAGTYGLTPEQFKAQLDAHGLKAVSGHFPYERYRDDVEGIARDARVLGLEYVGCAWIPHDDQAPFSEKTCREAIAVFNQAGAALAKHGLKFFYHVHGYEFQPYKDGTLFDLMMAERDERQHPHRPAHRSFRCRQRRACGQRQDRLPPDPARGSKGGS